MLKYLPLLALSLFGCSPLVAEASDLEKAQGLDRELKQIGRALHSGKRTDAAAQLASAIQRSNPAVDSSDTQLAGKLQHVHTLAEALQAAARGHGGEAAAWFVPEVPAGPRLHVADADSAGARCASPVNLQVDAPFVAELQAAGQTGDSLWLRWQAPTAGHFILDTYGSMIDSHLAVYAECGDIGSKALAENDDAIGLSSATVVEAAYAGQVFLVKASNLGKAGTAVVSAKANETIRGRITDEASALPLASVEVFAFQGSGTIAGWSSSGPDGGYTLALYSSAVDQPVTIRTRHQQRTLSGITHVDEAWPDKPCADYSYFASDCPGAQSLTVAANDSQDGVDFVLGTGLELTGTVTDERTGGAIPNAVVRVSRGTSIIRELVANEAGIYRTSGLQAGSVHLYARSPTHQAEFHHDKPCTNYFNCLVNGTGDALNLSAASTTVDMALTPWSYLDIDLTIDGQVITPTFASLIVTPTSGESISTSTESLGSGRFRVGPLTAGSYRLSATYPGLSFMQLYAGVDCASDCSAEAAQATPIQIAATGDRVRLAMDLRRLPLLRGKVTDGQTGEGIANARVYALAPGQLPTSASSSATTNASGEYTLLNIPPRSHYIYATANQYTNVMHPGIACESSAPLSNCPIGTPVSFGLNSGDRQLDFALQPSPRITGTLLSNGSPLPDGVGLHSGSVSLLNASLQPVDGVLTIDAQTGRYTLSDFAPGGYFLGAAVFGYYPQLFPRIDCPSGGWSSFDACRIKDATVVNAGHDQVVANFDLRRFGSRIVEVRDVVTQAPLAGISIDLWNASGQNLGGARTNAQGRAMITVNSSPQDMRLSTDNEQGYINEVYRDRQCPQGTSVYRGDCPLTGAEVVRLPDHSANPTPIVIGLSTPETAAILFVSGFE